MNRKRVFLKNPSIEEDERYTKLFKERKIKELFFAFNRGLKRGERGFSGKSHGARLTANEKGRQKYKALSIESKKELYAKRKENKNKRCKKCDRLISPQGKSELCQSCFQASVWEKRRKLRRKRLK